MAENTKSETRTATVRMPAELHAALTELGHRWQMSANRACIKAISRAVCAEEPCDAFCTAIKRWQEGPGPQQAEKGESWT